MFAPALRGVAPFFQLLLGGGPAGNPPIFTPHFFPPFPTKKPKQIFGLDKS